MIRTEAPPLDDDGIPLGHDPACSYWLRRRASLGPPMLDLIRHRQVCPRCMAYAERTAEQVDRSGYSIPR